MYSRFIIVTIFLVSCRADSAKHSFIGDKQVPIFNSSNSKIVIAGLDYVVKDSNCCASIIQTNKDYRLVRAYIGSDNERSCDFSKSLIDTSLKEISNCSVELAIKADTGIFCVTPTNSKEYIFKLATLSVDKNSSYYLDTIDIKFIAREKAPFNQH